jgi:hypothetical protein
MRRDRDQRGEAEGCGQVAHDHRSEPQRRQGVPPGVEADSRHGDGPEGPRGPARIQETADSIHAALTMSADERARRALGLKATVTQRNPGDWVDDQLDDIRQKARASSGAAR